MSAEAIVFSDLHFGDPRSLLHNSSQLEKLLLLARQHKPIRRVVLLGDIYQSDHSLWPSEAGARRLLDRIRASGEFSSGSPGRQPGRILETMAHHLVYLV